jgi:GNAT superfamily N-acetyltransferase
VHPAYQGQGIGTALAQWAETHVREAMVELPAGDRVTLVQRVLCADTAARTLLLDQGYQLAHTFVRMHVETDARPPRPTLPSGITIRPYRPGREERAVIYADYDAFREIEGEPPFEASYARWIRRVEADLTHDPSLWFVAVEDDEIVGAALCRPQADAGETMGWVNRLSVRAPWRRRGIGLALLQHVFGVFYRRGKHKVGLNVESENPTGAMCLYKKVGMHEVPELGTWQFEKVLKHCCA